MKKVLLALTIAASCAAAPAAFSQDRVRLLGVSTLASHEGDLDVVPVSCRPRIQAVKLRAVNSPAEIERIWLTYGNGEREQVRVRDYLGRGEETGWIDVSGGRRCVTEVAVAGDAERRGQWRDDDRGGYRGERTGYDGHDRRGRGRGWERTADVEIYGRVGW